MTMTSWTVDEEVMRAFLPAATVQRTARINTRVCRGVPARCRAVGRCGCHGRVSVVSASSPVCGGTAVRLDDHGGDLPGCVARQQQQHRGPAADLEPGGRRAPAARGIAEAGQAGGAPRGSASGPRSGGRDSSASSSASDSGKVSVAGTVICEAVGPAGNLGSDRGSA